MDMITRAMGAAAYAAYASAVGGKTHDGQPLLPFDQLRENTQAGWAAAAATAGFSVRVGQTVKTVMGTTGRVHSLSINLDGRRAIWLDGVDNTGRPFEQWVLEQDIVVGTEATTLEGAAS